MLPGLVNSIYGGAGGAANTAFGGASLPYNTEYGQLSNLSNLGMPLMGAADQYMGLGQEAAMNAARMGQMGFNENMLGAQGLMGLFGGLNSLFGNPLSNLGSLFGGGQDYSSLFSNPDYSWRM